MDLEPIEIKVNQHINLKQLQLEDSESLFKLVDGSREALRVWLPWVDTTTNVEDSENFIRGSLEAGKERGTFDLGIWYKEELVGVIGIHSFNQRDRRAALGYWLSNEFVGKGIMTESARGMIDFLFSKKDLNRVEIRCGVDNKRSAGVPMRLKFTFEGVAREQEWLNDHFNSLMVFSMLASEWR